MTAIKILLIMSFLAVLAWAFRNRRRVAMRASARIGALGLAGAAIASVADPDITQNVANLLGVVRGTDLLLYLMIVVFAVTGVGTYLRFREQERRLVRIVRAIAIRDAVASYGEPGAGRVGSGSEVLSASELRRAR